MNEKEARALIADLTDSEKMELRALLEHLRRNREQSDVLRR